ncbi:hypothetical protein SCUP515_06779 [Seiridium cupressi]
MDGQAHTLPTSTPCQTLPLEVWIEILGYLTDKAHLSTTWQSCRRVSHLFKVAAEKAYEYNCIRRWKVYLLLGYRHLPPRPGSNVERSTTVATILRFQKLSPDGQRIYFHDPEMKPPRWGIDRIGGDLHLIVHCLKRGSMDLIVGTGAYSLGTLDAMLDIEEGDLPSIDLEVDRQARTLSYRWKPFLSTFLANAYDGNPRAFYGKYGKMKPGRIVRGI